MGRKPKEPTIEKGLLYKLSDGIYVSFSDANISIFDGEKNQVGSIYLDLAKEFDDISKLFEDIDENVLPVKELLPLLSDLDVVALKDILQLYEDTAQYEKCAIVNNEINKRLKIDGN